MTTERIISESPESTISLFRETGRRAEPGTVLAFFGDLGAGKTTAAKAVAEGLGIEENVTSPTFTLMETYSGGRLPFYHFDLYRIEDEGELDNLFFEEYWEGDGVSVIEWAQRAGSRLPENAVKIYIEYVSETERSITIEYPDL